MKRLLLLCGLALLAVCSTPSKVFAQGMTETGAIAGRVTDPSGAVVPNAKVTVVNVGTSTTREATTGSKGAYVVPNLLPAVYTVTAEASGFARTEKRAEVTVGATVTVDFKLSVAAAPPTTVEVVGTAGVAVNTQNQTLSSVIDTKQLEELPTLTRNPYDLVLTTGMVSETDPSGRGVGVSINGLRAAGTNVLLDGGANNDEFTGSVGQAVPLDAVQEFSVLANNFGAQYGRASAGVVNVATKSGTNAFHGTVYEFHRDSALDSNTFDNNAQGRGPNGQPLAPKPIFTRNQFGYSVGGPVKKNKLFFFSSTEWTRVRSSGTVNELIPDPAFLAAANANTQNFFNTFGKLRPGLTTLAVFSRSTFPSDPCTKAAPGGPCQSYPLTAPMFDEVSYTTPTDSGGGIPENAYSMVHRVDWVISPNTQFYARYAFDNEIQFPGSVSTTPYVGYDTGTNIRNQNALLAFTHAFSPTFLSSTKFVFNRLKLVQPLGQQPVSPVLFLTQIGGSIATIPTAFPGYLDLTPGSGIPFGGPQNLFQTYEDVTYVKGSHTYQFGGSYVLIQDNRTFGAYEEASEILGKNVGKGLDNFLNGQLFQLQTAINPQGHFPCRETFTVVGAGTSSARVVPSLLKTPQCSVVTPVGPPNFSRSNRYNEIGAYFQDSWKMRPRLTINLGLRWDYFGIQHNKDPRLDSNYYDGGGGSIFERIRNGDVSIADQSAVGGLWAKDRKDFGPRIGFAWDVFGNGRTSLRGGYGIAYERNFGNVTFNVIQNPPNYAVISVLNGVDVPAGTLPVTTENFGPLSGSGITKALPPVSLRNVNAKIKSAYAHLWSLSLEHQFGGGIFFGVDYSGSKGKRLYSIENPNRPGSGVVFLGDPCADLDGDGAPDFGNPDACRFDRLRRDQYTNINRRGGSSFSLYNALNLRTNLQNTRIFGWHSGLSASVVYTYSHAIDTLSSTFSESFNNINLGLLDPFNAALDRGPADFDIRHRIAVSGVWDLPFARNTKGVWKKALDGWSVAPVFTARSGSPFSIFDCTFAVQVCPRAFNLPGTSGLPRNGPDNQAVPGQPNLFTFTSFTNATPVFDASGNCLADCYVNPLVGVSDFGPYPANITGRNIFHGPGAWTVDFGFYKTTAITERLRIQFRAEMFNAFNHSNLYIQSFENDVSSFSELDAKRGVPPAATIFTDFGLQERRNVQLALKLIF